MNDDAELILEDSKREQMMDRAALNLRLFEEQMNIGILTPVTTSIVQAYMVS